MLPLPTCGEGSDSVTFIVQICTEHPVDIYRVSTTPENTGNHSEFLKIPPGNTASDLEFLVGPLGNF